MTLTKQDKARKQKLRQEAAVVDELKRKYNCSRGEHWEEGGVFEQLHISIF